MKRIIVLILTILFVPVVLHAARPGRRTPGARLDAAAASVAGRAPGTFGVTNGGAAKYVVPLATPPGIGRAEPSLSIVYSSQAGLGMAGYGADLGGLPVIGRTRAIFAIDGFAGGINYDANDRFAFSGQRLINTSGGYGADGTTYHTEIEHWTVVVSHGQCGAGPCWFSATARDGTQYEFGNTTDSRILAAGRADVRVWALNEMTDTNGSSMAVTYTQSPVDCTTGASLDSPGGYYPLRIDYSANGAAGVAPNRSVQFSWAGMTNPQVQYQGGAVITTAATLCGMTSATNGIAASSYRFSYAPAPVTNRTRLTSLQRCDSAGANANCLTPTTLQWQNGAGAFNASAAAATAFTFNAGWTTPEDYPRTVADVNGDGRADLIGFRNGVQVALAVEGQTAYAAPSTWSSAFSFDDIIWTDAATTPRYVTDLNGDGLADIVGFGSDGVHFAYSTGSAFTAPQTITNLFTFETSLFPKLVADVNGDGLADLLCLKGGVQVALSTGTGFQTPSTWISDFSFDVGGWSSETPRVLGDVNGDGRADIVGFANTGVVVGISNGTSFVESWPAYPFFGFDSWDPEFFPRSMADVNGDGLADIVGFQSGTQVGLSTGAGFLPPAQWIDDFSFDGQQWQVTMPRYLADVNGDRLADVIGFSQTLNDQPAVKVALSTGSSFSESSWNNASLQAFGENSSTWTPVANPTVSTDANGDGLMDAIAFGQNSVWVATSAGPWPDLASTVTDGLGAVHSVTYEPISNSAIYTPAAPQSGTASALAHQSLPVPSNTPISVFPTQNVQGGRFYVVTSVIASNDASINPGGAYSNTSTYRYAGALIDLSGRGWLGFGSFSKTAPSGKTTVTALNQLFPLTGTPQTVQVFCGSSSDPRCTGAEVLLGNEVTSYYNCGSVTGCGAPAATCQPFPNVDQVLRASTRTDFYTYGAYEFSRGKTYCYDAYGNTAQVADLGYVSQQGSNLSTTDDVYTFNGYLNEPGEHLGLLLWSRTTTNPQPPSALSCAAPASFGTGDYRASAFAYDANGNTTQSCSWDDQSARWSSQSFTYDAFGNAVTATDAAGNVTTTTYDATYHAFPATEVSPPNANGVALTRYFGYDPRFGSLAAKTDANCNARVPAACNVTTFTTDAFGRATGIQGPAPLGGGVVASANQVTPFVTGSLPFAQASVVTLSSGSWIGDATGIRLAVSSTQTWPTQTPAATAAAFRQVDAKGRPFKLGMTGAASPLVMCRTYTPNGSVRSSSLPIFGSNTTDCGAATLWSSVTRDAYERPTILTRPAGPDGSQTATTTVAWPTQRSTVITHAAGNPDAYSRAVTYDYFASQRRPVSAALQQAAATSFSYDSIGELVTVTEPSTPDNPNGVVNSFAYDSLGRVVQEQDPNRGKWTYAYGPRGNVTTMTDAMGNATQYGYDALNRRISSTVANGPSATWTWDGTACANGLGRLAAAAVTGQQMPVSRTFCYDRTGNVTATTATLGTQAFQAAATYDPQNRLTSSTMPDGSIATMTWAGCCALQSVSLGGTPYATYSGFNALNVATTERFGNGVVNTYTYSPAGELIAHSAADKAGTPVFRYAVTWDLLGRVTAITDALAAPDPGTSQSYTYAPPAHLLTAQAPGLYGTQSFQWDVLGNRTAANGVAYRYSGHAPVSAPGFSATYDANGNLIANESNGAETIFQYDAANRLVSVQPASGGTIGFIYDANGLRVGRTGGDGTITLMPFASYHAITEPARSSIRFVDGARATVAAVTPSGASFFHTNQILSTFATTDASGLAANTARIVYRPFGNVLSSTLESTVTRTFTQRELDPESAVYYYPARYYDPALGTFISPDPNLGASLTQPGAFNRYMYGLGNPTSGLDPDGGAWCPMLVCIASLGSGAFWVASAATGEITQLTHHFNFVAAGLSVVSGLGSCPQAYRDWRRRRIRPDNAHRPDGPPGGGPDNPPGGGDNPPRGRAVGRNRVNLNPIAAQLGDHNDNNDNEDNGDNGPLQPGGVPGGNAVFRLTVDPPEALQLPPSYGKVISGAGALTAGAIAAGLGSMMTGTAGDTSLGVAGGSTAQGFEAGLSGAKLDVADAETTIGTEEEAEEIAVLIPELVLP